MEPIRRSTKAIGGALRDGGEYLATTSTLQMGADLGGWIVETGEGFGQRVDAAYREGGLKMALFEGGAIGGELAFDTVGVLTGAAEINALRAGSSLIPKLALESIDDPIDLRRAKPGGAPLAIELVDDGVPDIVYRGLSEADARALAGGQGLVAKAPNGTWTAAEHVANAGPGAGGAAAHSPWISTTRQLDIAQAYDSGHGVVAIDLKKVSALQVEVWRDVPRVGTINTAMDLAYHRSIWAQEVTIRGSIPREAIIGSLP